MQKTHGISCVLLGAVALLAAGLVQAQTAPATTTAATASVAQAQFTTAVTNREPADDISTLDNSHNQVFFFTVLENAAGQTITHRWEYHGQTMAEVKFEPKSKRWRVWSSKTLLPSQTGTWTVEVVDGSGHVLTSKTLNYTQAQGMAEPDATHKVMPNATHKVLPAARQATKTPAPSAATGGG